jgi:hypothetical protein
VRRMIGVMYAVGSVERGTDSSSEDRRRRRRVYWARILERIFP